MKVAPSKLYRELAARLPPSPAMLGDLPAVMVGIAAAESFPMWELNSVGDNGESLGLFQINRSAYPAEYKALQEDMSLRSQLETVQRPVRDRLPKVGAWAFIRGGKGLPVPTFKMATTWFQISWQYGPAAVTDWLRESKRHDASGFIGWRQKTGKKIWGGPEAVRKRDATVWRYTQQFSKSAVGEPSEGPVGVVGAIVIAVAGVLVWYFYR